MATKRMKDLISEVESLGYAYDRTNSKGCDFFVHEDTGCELRMPNSANESTVRQCVRIARHQIGLPTKDNKRNPQAIRERNAAEHERAKRELERLRFERETLQFNRDEERLRAIEDAYLRAERKFRYWDRLMRGAA